MSGMQNHPNREEIRVPLIRCIASFGQRRTGSRNSSKYCVLSQRMTKAAKHATTRSAVEPRLNASTQAPTDNRIRSPPDTQPKSETRPQIPLPTPDSVKRVGINAKNRNPPRSGSSSATQPLTDGKYRGMVMPPNDQAER